jgi:hypothetical protein
MYPLIFRVETDYLVIWKNDLAARAALREVLSSNVHLDSSKKVGTARSSAVGRDSV